MEAWESYGEANKRDSLFTNKQGNIKWTTHTQQVLKVNVGVEPLESGGES